MAFHSVIRLARSLKMIPNRLNAPLSHIEDVQCGVLAVVSAKTLPHAQHTLALIPTGLSTVHPPNKLAKILWETFGKEEGR